MNTNTTVNTSGLPTQASASFLGTLNISVYTSRKKDKQTSAEVQLSKGAASSQAVSSYKNLFAECGELKAILSYSQDCRNWFNRVTRTWDDNGTRQIPTATFYEIDNEITNREARFTDLVNAFLRIYDVQVSKQAFMLGALFNREEFPAVQDVGHRFSFRFTTTPLPLSGHFSLDMEKEMVSELSRRYEAEMKRRISATVGELFGRVKDHIEHIQERMAALLAYEPDATEETRTLADDGTVIALDIKKTRRPKLYQTMMDNALEQCGLLDSLNIENDPKLRDIQSRLYNALVSCDIDTLKTSPEMQQSLKTKMDDLLSEFDF
jgi:hypothetical protein